MASKGVATAGTAFVRLLVPAGKAAPTPPVGPALGARGVKSMDFCKEFNARTAHLEPGTPTPTVITINSLDRTFQFRTKSPPTSWFIRRAAGVEKGSGSTPPGRGLVTVSEELEGGDASKAVRGPKPKGRAAKKAAKGAGGKAEVREVGTITLKHVYEIARIKQGDDHLSHVDLEALARSVLGTCLSMGVRVVP